MRFLILTQYFPPEIGAAPTRLASVIHELQAFGHEVEVVTALPNYPVGKVQPGYSGTFYRRETRDGITVHRTWLYATAGSGVPRLLNFLSFMTTSLYGLSQAAKPDFLFVESPPLFLTPAAYVYSRLRGVPFIMNVADLWPDMVMEMGLIRKGLATDVLGLLERWSYRKAAYVTAITQGIRTTLLSEKGVKREKVLFLPNGVDTSVHRPEPPNEELKQSLGLSGKKIVLYAGTMGRAHGLQNVLKCAQLLEHQPEIHFLFLGDGSERPALQQLQSELGLHNVSFHDFVPISQLHSYYSIAACGLASLLDVPMFEVARPSKIFGVLASGKPIVYCGKGEGARLVEQANAGVVVPPEDSTALADAISRLLSKPGLVRELGENGRRFVEEKYEWSKLVGSWLSNLAPPIKQAFPASVP